MSVQHIAVAGGNIPPTPTGAVVHQRGAPQAPAPAPVAPAAPQVPEFKPAPYDPALFQQPAPAPQPPAAPAAPAVDQTLQELLAALSTQKPAQPVAAPVPEKPTVAPVAGSDPVINSLQSVLVTSGLDYQRAVGRALKEGDSTLIDFAYIAERGGDAAEHLRSVAEGLVAHQTAIDARLEQDVYQKFGGEANWDASISYFAKTVPQTTKDYVVGLLETRNPALIEQAANLVMDHVKQAGAHLSPAGLVQAGATATGVQPLGKDEFKREIAALNPRDPNWEKQRQELFARRSYGKQLGR